MWRKQYLYDVDGEISQILPNEAAEIKFVVDGKPEKAYVKKARFFHGGRLIPENVPFSKYIRNNMQVKFSCHALEQQEGAAPNPYHNIQYHWYAMMCWANSWESPLSEVTTRAGIFSTIGNIIKITKRHGILTMSDGNEDDQKVAFLASKVYIHGKRFPSSKMLNTQLALDMHMFFDAVPCIPEEDRDNCRWFATCAFQGKRPRLASPFDNVGLDVQANYCLVQKPNPPGTNADGSQNEKLNQLPQSPTNLKNRLLKIINLYTSNPRTLFTTGYGFILDILNDEFGIILGCFKKNVYQTILFHRKHAFLFKVSLARAKLSEVFVEGDRMKFIAVGAPTNFYTDWIAVQVSVSPSLHSTEDSAMM